jgi:phosphomannomutase
MNPLIFRAYDIRGTYGKSITQLTTYIIALNFAKLTLKSNNSIIYVGQDCRISSPYLFAALCQGLSESGYQVISIGIVATPMLYFIDYIKKPTASIMITGSHNPKDDNGFKILHNGRAFFGDDLLKLQEMCLSDNVGYLSQAFDISTQDVCDSYIDALLKAIKINANLKVVWDLGNGAAGSVVSKLVQKLPNSNILINEVMDGNFPNHHPDPTVIENLEQLKNKVLKTGSDFGVAFDGDGDRIGVISNTGNFIYADTLMCLFVQDILSKNIGANFVFDIKSSNLVTNVTNELGGHAHLSKTGHVFMKEKMHNVNAVFGGELSGHLFFNDRYYGYDDGIYAALRLMEVLSDDLGALQARIDKLPKTFTLPETRIKTQDKFKIIQSIKLDLVDEGIKFDDLDGVKVCNNKGWWLLRASNTEEHLVLRAEGFSPHELEALLRQVDQFLQKYGLSSMLHNW